MLKILIVEDEYMSRTGLGHLIEKIDKDCKVVGYAEDGYEGMKLAKEHNPDVIIADIKMPRMNGLEMFKNLRKVKMKCCFVILTGYAEFEFAQQGIAVGIVEYLLKPVTVSKVRDLLETLKARLNPQLEMMVKEEELAEQPYSLLVSKVVHVIKERYQEKLTLESLADRYSVTPEYLSGLFSKEVGKPFINYLKEFRIMKAKEILQKEGGKKIYEVAFEVGYADVKYFCRVFKEITGITPRKYTQYGVDK